MLPINRLLEYQAEVIASLFDEQGNKIFNYTAMIINDLQLSKVLKERKQEDNTYLISVMPEFNMKGDQDRAKWENILMFFILDKTDYSENDHDDYIDIFAQTQAKAQAFVNKLLADKSNPSGSLCSFLSNLDENSIRMVPTPFMNGCNGWSVEINLDTPL
jgi:hypothetical protein